MNPQQLKNIIEAAVLTAGGALPMVRLQALFSEQDEQPDSDQIKQVLDELSQDYTDRGIELTQVASGFRIQATQDMAQWLNRLNEDKPARYSRALLETLALIAYRQPITRAGVEDVRGVSVSSSIIKTLLEREWIRVVGHRDVPGRPTLYGTTKQFLDYFNLKSLSELPALAEMRSIEDIQSDFDLNFNNNAAISTDEQDQVDSPEVAQAPVDDLEQESLPENADAAMDAAVADIEVTEIDATASENNEQQAHEHIDEQSDEDGANTALTAAMSTG